MRKKLGIGLFFLSIIFMISAFTFKVSAQEQTNNSMIFNYVYKSGTKNSVNNSMTIIEDNVVVSKDLTIGENKTTLLSVLINSNSFFNKESNILENDVLNLQVDSLFETNSIEIKNESEEIISSSTTNSIVTSLEDGTYTISYVGISTWIQKTNISEISRMSKVTATMKLTVQKTLPIGNFIKSQENNFAYFTWENQNWTAFLDDTPYSKNTWIETEGLHKIVLTNGTIYREYNIYIDHFYKEVSKEEATCEKEGKIIRECSQCKQLVTDVIPKFEHQYQVEIKVPTCSEMGGTLHRCEMCGDEYLSDITSPLGHRYKEEWLEASCTENGGLLHSCLMCDYEYLTDVIFPSGHDLISVITQEATCEEAGSRHHTCEKCNLDYTTEIPPLNHNYEITKEESSHGSTHRTYTCKTCGKTYVQDLGNPYEKVTNYVVFLFDSYSPFMLWIFLATTGIWSVAMGISIIIAHKHEEQIKSKRMIVNYFIGLIVIFVILVACPFLVKGIASII